MGKIISKAEANKCAKVVAAYTKQEAKKGTAKAVKTTKEVTKKGYYKIKNWLKK